MANTTVYKVIYFTPNNVIQCRTFNTQAGATEYATGLGSIWKKVVSYQTSQTVTDINLN